MRLFSIKKDTGRLSLKKRLLHKFRFRFRTKDRRKAIQARLPELAGDLEAAYKEIEPSFIRTGIALQTISTDVGELTQQVLGSINLIGGKSDEGVLFQMRTLAEAPMTELEGCQADMTQETERINTVITHLSALSTIFPLIKTIGLRLRIIAMSINIESARLNGSTDLFAVVAKETTAFSEKINTISDTSLDVLDSARQSQRSLYDNLVKGLQKINRLGENARLIVREAIREITQLMTSSLQVVKQAGEHSKAISQQVGEIVVAVQFHDSMKQRMEHIIEALDDVEQILAQDFSKTTKADQKQHLSRVFSIVNVQSAQLKEIVTEIDHVYEKGLQSFEEILKEIDALINHLSFMNTAAGQNPERQGEAGDPFKKLESSFGDLNSLVSQSQNLMDAVRHAAAKASDTVDRVSGFVREIHNIGFEAHLMSLNTIVMVAHLGQERGALEVLAQEIKQTSDQSSAIVGRTDELLELVTGVAGQLREQGALNKTKISLEDSMAEISQAYNRFVQGAAMARERADEIRNAISETKASLDFLPRLARKLTGCQQRFEAIFNELSPFASEGDGSSRTAANNIFDRYTMEKERNVHRTSLLKVAGQPDRANADHSPLLPKAAPAQEPAQEGDLFGDNVELF